MPDILEMIAQNPEMAQSLEEQPQAPTAYTVAPQTPEQYGKSEDQRDQIAQLPSVTRARMHRSASILSDPDLQASIETHHQAVADANAYHHQTSQELSYLHAAHTYHDTAAFYQETHGMDPNDPKYEDKMLALAAKYPYAKPDAELMQPLHEARKTVLAANSAIERRKSDSEVQQAMEKGHLTLDDLAAYNTPNGLNYQALKFLAGSRAGQTQMPNEFERELIKTYGAPGSPQYNKLYQAVQKGDPRSIAIHDAYWTGLKKADPGLAARVGSAPAGAAAPAQTHTW